MINSKKFKMSFPESKVVLDKLNCLVTGVKFKILCCSFFSNLHRKMYLIVAILQIECQEFIVIVTHLV